MKGGKLSKIPTVVQLPGGLTLRGLPFRIIERHANGAIKSVELLPQDTPASSISLDSDCLVLFGHEQWMRAPNPRKVPAT